MNPVNPDPQQWEVPKLLHFVWMGKKPIPPPKSTDFTDGDGKFRSRTVLENARVNPDCRSVMWIDAFTMVPPETIQKALPPALWAKYSRWARLAMSPENGGLQPSRDFGTDLQIARDPANFNTIVNMLFEVRIQFNEWFHLRENNEEFYKNPESPIGGLAALVAEANQGLEPGRTPMQLTLLDTAVYPDWMRDPSKPEYKLVSWIFYELYMRGSNFGAVSDMIRAQLLIDQGGLYVDHDDELVRMHDPATIPGGPPYRGFKHLLDTTPDQLDFDVHVSKKMLEEARAIVPIRASGSQGSSSSNVNPPPVNGSSNPQGESSKPPSPEKITQELYDFARFRGPELDSEDRIPAVLTRQYYINVATTGYLAAPPAHPFVIFFRDRMLVDYARLLTNDYYWLGPTGKTMSSENVRWFDFKRGKNSVTKNWADFANFGIQVTGPGQLDKCLTFVAKPSNNLNMGRDFIISCIEQRAKNHYSNSWVAGGSGNV